jgi:hypothetical protein
LEPKQEALNSPLPQSSPSVGSGGSTIHFTLRIVNCVFSNIRGTYYGAIVLDDSPNDALISDTVFRDCTATIGSAILAVKVRQLVLTRCTFERNMASALGTVYRGNPWDDTPTPGFLTTLQVLFCSFTNNTAGAGGAGVYSPFGGIYYPLVAQILDSNFTNNVAVGTANPSYPQAIGGAMVLTGGYALSSIERCRFIGNGVSSPYPKDVVVSGGAIYMTSFYTSFTIADTLFDSNFAETSLKTASAGAIGYVCFQIQHTLTISGSVFRNNRIKGLYFNQTRTSSGGGAISVLQYPNAALRTSLLCCHY